MLWKSPKSSLKDVRLCDLEIPREVALQFANSGEPDQTLQNAPSDLGLHCLSVTHFGVLRLKWVKT